MSILAQLCRRAQEGDRSKVTQSLRKCLAQAGYDDETIAAIAASPEICAILAEFYELRAAHQEEGGRGVEVRGSTAVMATQKVIDNRGRVLSDAERVCATAHALFGGFRPRQVQRLLAVCRYRKIPVENLLRIMYQLREESWSRGWVRTRDALNYAS